MIVYKVLRNENSKLFSYTEDKKREYKYRLNVWLSPKLKGSRFFVFDSYTHAAAFVHLDYKTNLEIYQCEALEVIPHRYLSYNFRSYDNRIKERWNIFNKFIEQHKAAKFPMACPYGTMFAKSIKLIKKV